MNLNICRFGKAHYGKPWDEVPSDYLTWMVENVSGNAVLNAQRELERRKKATFSFATLTGEQCAVGELIETGNNVVLTGAAGCGKSYIVKQIGNKLMLCPTGISAINASGQTFHSFFRIDPSDPLLKVRIGLKITEALVVFDEIFFTSPVLLDSILRQYPEICKKQLIFTGDPYQLPPVKYKGIEDAGEEEYDEDELDLIAENKKTGKGSFYDVLLKHGISVRTIELQTSVRHKNDPIFAEALSRVRIGKASHNDIMLLNTRVADAPDDSLVLTFRKARVKEYNAEYLKKFKTVSYSALAFDNVDETKRELPWYLKEKRAMRKAPAPFETAVGCHVVVLYNDMQANGARFVNGDLGTVEQCAENYVLVRLLRNNELLTFEQDHIVKGKKYLGYYNFGLAVAKAMTIHKSQGCTIYGNVHIHIDDYLARKWHGALYTAMSRCGTLAQVTFNQKILPSYLKQSSK
jgi:hypothetical protein